MVKKIYGVNENGDQVELDFKRFVIVTDNDSKVEMDTEVKKHAEAPDLAFNICTGPVFENPDQPGLFKAEEGHRYFSMLPGACNLLFLKVIRKE